MKALLDEVKLGNDHTDIDQAYLQKLLYLFTQEKRVNNTKLLDHPIETLTKRELEVLACIAKGMTNHAVAETLHLSVGTVKWHLDNIYAKLLVKNRTQAIARGREIGLL